MPPRKKKGKKGEKSNKANKGVKKDNFVKQGFVYVPTTCNKL